MVVIELIISLALGLLLGTILSFASLGYRLYKIHKINLLDLESDFIDMQDIDVNMVGSLTKEIPEDKDQFNNDTIYSTEIIDSKVFIYQQLQDMIGSEIDYDSCRIFRTSDVGKKD